VRKLKINKSDRLCNALFKASLEPYIPRGAYYILADISRLPGATSKERAIYLLGKTKVACVPGEAFYHDEGGENLGRFCFAKEDSILDEACRRLERLRL
jgi:aminotransferase